MDVLKRGKEEVKTTKIKIKKSGRRFFPQEAEDVRGNKAAH